MSEPTHRAPTAASELTPAQVGILHLAALRSNEGPAILASLATIIPCDAQLLAAVRIEDIDRPAGTLTVHAPDGTAVEVALGFQAARTVQSAIGGRRAGFLVPGPYRDVIEVDACTQDYARELLTTADPRCDFGWSFRSVRESGLAALLDHGMPYAVVEAQIGLPSACQSGDRLDNILAQRCVSEWWGACIGLPVPSPFQFTGLSKLIPEDWRAGRGA